MKAEPRLADVKDLKLVAGIAAAGFYDDPVMGWVFPDHATRRAQLRIAFMGLAHRHTAEPGLMYVLDDACAAFWRPPGFSPSAGSPDSSEESPADPEAPAVFEAEVLDRFGALGAAMAAAHPEDPHWYLGVVATRPERQSQGLGGRILAPVLALCDTEGLPAYLESSNARNIPFYWRLGFEQRGEINVPNGPTLYPMWRDPR